MMKSEYGNIWPNIFSKPKVLAIDKIKSADDIFQVLNCIRLYGSRDDKVTEKLVCLLMKQKEWKHKHGMELYELILRQYADEDILDQLLAVSGRSEEYRKLNTAAKRRSKYNNSHDEMLVGTDSMDKEEKKNLYYISRNVYDDFCKNDSRLLSLYETWLSQIGLDPKILNKPDDSEVQKKTEPRGSQMGIQTTAHESKKINTTKGREKERDQKKTLKIKIKSLKLFCIEISKEKPQRGVLALVMFLIIILPMFICFYQQNKFLNIIWYDVIKDLNTEKPKIISISSEDTIDVTPGAHKDPHIKVIPGEAGKDNLQYEVDNKNIADLTSDWMVMGGDGWRKGADNTTFITLWGDNAKPVRIKVTLYSKYVDKADKDTRTSGGVGEHQ